MRALDLLSYISKRAKYGERRTYVGIERWWQTERAQLSGKFGSLECASKVKVRQPQSLSSSVLQLLLLMIQLQWFSYQRNI